MTKPFVPLHELPLYATDAELGPAILGDRARDWPRLAALYEHHGLPKVNVHLGGRYTPAVRKFLDAFEGVSGSSPLPGLDGPEDMSAWRSRRTVWRPPDGQEKGTPNQRRGRKPPTPKS